MPRAKPAINEWSEKSAASKYGIIALQQINGASVKEAGKGVEATTSTLSLRTLHAHSSLFRLVVDLNQLSDPPGFRQQLYHRARIAEFPSHRKPTWCNGKNMTVLNFVSPIQVHAVVLTFNSRSRRRHLVSSWVAIRRKADVAGGVDIWPQEHLVH